VANDRGGRGVQRTLTVIIPALNEAAALPALLDSLRRQTVRPDAVIVADAHSTDGTREVAVAHGASVVDGGMPGAGRNAGARAAETDLLLFLDADVALTDGAIAAMLEEFDRRALVVAGAQIRPIERDPRYVFACEVVNFYLEMMQYVEPHAPGCCILVTRDVHEAIGGFDETLALAEDHDYVERAAEHGRFRILRRAHVRTSMRRLAKEGLVSLAFKYLYCELQVVTGQKILAAPFDYEFAAFAAPDEVPTRRGLSKLRERVTTLTEAIRQVSSDGRDALRELGDTEIDLALMERSLARLRTDDVRALERYVKVRARLVRRGSRRAVSRVRRMADAVRRELTR
jgi:glycosyltransferase involved in cell wall biosynthesis